ncbi:THAP9 [Mytilus edulis]|uniref:THAP9 n=1 Tax=Mytilus edulis TaxID=6550 RepID=A0A8S3R2U9_MYTED|nr:THAP9 [Mytilus edulis]
MNEILAEVEHVEKVDDIENIISVHNNQCEEFKELNVDNLNQHVRCEVDDEKLPGWTAVDQIMNDILIQANEVFTEGCEVHNEEVDVDSEEGDVDNKDEDAEGDADNNTSVEELLPTNFVNQNVQHEVTAATTQTESPLSELSEFEQLVCTLKSELSENYILFKDSNRINILEPYHVKDQTDIKIKLSVVIDANFLPRIFVHNKEIGKDNNIWTGLPTVYNNIDSVQKLLARLRMFFVCVGNPDEQFQYITPVGSGISDAFTNEIRCYREGDYGATKWDTAYTSTIRSVKCQMLVQGSRCSSCAEDRRMLRKRQQRAEEKKTSPPVTFVHRIYQHKHMSRENLVTKIEQQKTEMRTLSSEVEKLKRQLHKQILQNGVTFSNPIAENIEMKDLMSTCQNDFEQAFPNPNSLQRLFWEQQIKFNSAGKNGMRWHPMLIRWCLFMRSKSAKAYDSMRDSGFIKLPSTRTLFDYSHYTKSALGFQPDVMKMLHDEASKLAMYEDNHKSFVGILFDEIKIQEDLVYDKHTGELIGFCDLDSIGNEILNLENLVGNCQKSQVAKFMLVIMVRGVTSNLKFPLAGFATNSITADFLYPIIWKAVSLIECVAKLKVLFCTCDGASANRRFFQLHKIDNSEEPVYFTINPHDNSRNLYFISDVPHLIKTARNCFSNSFSHKNTRRLWKNGKDISWMHMVRLFEEHCELQLYSPCPKLTRSHIDLAAFTYMKVNLAAQILSGSVANALEHLYDDSVSETVLFIRNFNKFFDCLNVRNLFEGRNKRNPNLEPFTGGDDPRLNSLKSTFLDYLKEWKQSVMQRPNLTPSQKLSMQLSAQTIAGVKISINSITECVKFMLDQGADFVLTYNFKQDPLKQHFGHYRHKGGANNNPSVYEVRHTMTHLRAVGAQALNPKRGNITNVNNNENVIDNTKLQRNDKY